LKGKREEGGLFVFGKQRAKLGKRKERGVATYPYSRRGGERKASPPAGKKKKTTAFPRGTNTCEEKEVLYY